MASQIKREAMKRRWQEHREEMLAQTSGATKAYKAVSEADKCIRRWRSVRKRWPKVQDREAMRG